MFVNDPVDVDFFDYFFYLRMRVSVGYSKVALQPEVEGYTDSDYAGNLDNQKLTLGYTFTYGGNAISWRSKLQECIALSTTKTEYIAASNAVKEAI